METWNPTRKEYVDAICQNRQNAIDIPFVAVKFEEWEPAIADCHNNVDRYVAARPGSEAVRGWIAYASFGPEGTGYTAHSIVRNRDGQLIDITPVYPGADRGGEFIEHLGDEALFLAMRTESIHLTCPSLDPEGDLRMLQEMLGDYGVDPNASELDILYE